MSKYSKIAIAIDQSDIDTLLFQAFKTFDHLIFEAESVHILYARNLSKLEKQFIQEHKELNEVEMLYEQKLHDELMDKILGIVGEDYRSKTTVNIMHESPLDEVLKFNQEHKVDCYIVGKKKQRRRSGRFAKELIRRVEAPVLMIPEKMDKDFHIGKIMVPYDFSDNSDKAVFKARTISQSVEGSSVECFSIIDIPLYDTEIILSQHLLFTSMEKDEKEAFAKKMEELGITDPPAFETQVKNNFIAKDVVKRARKKDFSMIVMGAKGHSAIERFFMGSVTESLIANNNRFPLLIVK